MCPLYRTSPDTARSATRSDVTAYYDVSHEGSARVLHRHFAGWRQQTVYVPISHRVMDNQFVDGQIDIVLAKHGEVERRLGKWLHQTHGTGIVARQGALRLITSVPVFSTPGTSLCKTPLLTSANEIAHK